MKTDDLIIKIGYETGKVSLSLIDIMRLCESWCKEKNRLDNKK